MLSLALALLAAGCNAVSSVFQRKANIAEAKRRSFGASLLLHLLSRPAWLLGIVAMIASFLLQAAALNFGTLAAVEPVLVLELPLALILGAVVLRRRLKPRDWVASAMMATGLATLIAVLAPRGGDAGSVSTPVALLAMGTAFVVVLILVLLGRFGSERRRAALFGVAAGAGFGVTAGLIKLAVARLSADGVGALFVAWETYGLVVVGVGAVGLVQAALNAGTLVAAQPGITLGDPIVAVLWGITVVGEQTRTGPVLVLAGLGAVLIAVAVIWLAHATSRADAAN